MIATINEKTGGGTKYINRRDVDYLPAAIQEENYRKNFTDAIKKYVDGHKTYKYAQITDMVYKAVFRGKAKENKKPIIYDARQKMASRDLAFRDVFPWKLISTNWDKFLY